MGRRMTRISVIWLPRGVGSRAWVHNLGDAREKWDVRMTLAVRKTNIPSIYISSGTAENILSVRLCGRRGPGRSPLSVGSIWKLFSSLSRSNLNFDLWLLLFSRAENGPSFVSGGSGRAGKCRQSPFSGGREKSSSSASVQTGPKVADKEI